MKIINGLVFDENKMTQKDLCFENGIITQESEKGEYDASGCYVLPGFIDTHIHGAYGVEFCSSKTTADDYKKALDFLSRQGVTGVLLTFAAESVETYEQSCEKIEKCRDDRILGIHAEGPFINPVRKGGLNPRYLRLPDVEIPKMINRKSGNKLKIMTLSPETEGAYELIREMVGDGVTISLGHTDATFEEAEKAADLGATRITHLYNAMRSFNHRDPGILGCALADDRLCCELICDLHHVSEPAIKLAIRSKGIYNVTIVSDTDFFCGLPDGEYEHNRMRLLVEKGFARLPDGTIAGSACTMAVGAKNLYKMGFKPEEIAVMGCVNPARAAGCQDRGELKTGYRADIIILDREFNVKTVFVNGKVV